MQLASNMNAIDPTVPGRSLDPQFDLMWQRFQRLSRTTDSLNKWSARFKRWLTPVNVSFVIPINDPTVCDYLCRAQEALRPHLQYDPQPADKLHITLFQLGYLKQTPLPIPHLWKKAQLYKIATLAQEYLRLMESLDVEVGPINAFPNVAIAEVRDQGRLRLLRRLISRAIPPMLLPLNFPLIPHITLGYFGSQPTTPICETILPMRNWPHLPLKIDHVEMTLYYRKPELYKPSEALIHSEERVMASLPIGS
jgi:2'-5' RNA ligase